MQMVVYLLFICLMIYLVFLLLPIILPIVVILVIGITVYLYYLKRKISKHMDAYSEEMRHTFQDNTSYESYQERKTGDDIIDVEFSETIEDEDK